MLTRTKMASVIIVCVRSFLKLLAIEMDKYQDFINVNTCKCKDIIFFLSVRAGFTTINVKNESSYSLL